MLATPGDVRPSLTPPQLPQNIRNSTHPPTTMIETYPLVIVALILVYLVLGRAIYMGMPRPSTYDIERSARVSEASSDVNSIPLQLMTNPHNPIPTHSNPMTMRSNPMTPPPDPMTANESSLSDNRSNRSHPDSKPSKHRQCKSESDGLRMTGEIRERYKGRPRTSSLP